MRKLVAEFTTLTVVATFITLASLSAHAEKPRVPIDDQEVLERLPKMLSLNRDSMAKIRTQLAADPGNSQLAAAAAQGYIKMGNDESDPRFYGYARSAIAPWWNESTPKAEVLKLRAKLKEKDHKYLEAIADLESLLVREPQDAQGWVELINLYRVVGQYDQARSAVGRLEAFADPTTVMVSQIPLMACTGDAETAYQRLLQQREIAEKEKSDLLPWIIATQANIDAMLMRVEDADTNFRAALALNSGNIHLKRTYADFLLDFQHPEPVLQLLKEHENDNGCLLLMAIAAKRLKKDDLAARLKSKIEVRFDEIRLRGNKPHGRFESRFELTLNRNPRAALEVALENWQVQKEVRDSRAVLEAALGANEPAAAQPVVDFLKTSKCEDAALNTLIQKLEQK